MEGKYPIMIDDALAGTLEVTKKGAMTVFDARCRATDELLRLSVYGDGGEGYLGVMVPEGGEMRLRRSMSPLSMRGFPEEIVAAGPSGRGDAGGQGTAEKDAAPRSGGEASASDEISGEEKREITAPPEKMAEGGGEEAPPVPAETDCKPEPEEAQAPCEEPPEQQTEKTPCERPPEQQAEEAPCEEPPKQREEETPCEKSAGPAGEEREQKKPAAPPEADNASRGPGDLCWYASPDGALVCFDGVHSLIALPPEDERVPGTIPGQPRRIEGRDYLVYVTKNGRIVS